MDAFSAIVGEKYALQHSDEIQPFVTEMRGVWPGATPLVLRPASTDEVSKILALAYEINIAIFPQGGNTGLVGAQTPTSDSPQIVLSLGRMNVIRHVDAIGNTMVVEAGCILQTLQEAADAEDRLFPLSLGSEGSCQIGGNISSNAGGTGVLAYGNTRDLVMGLEVVLADGRIWNGLNRLKKNNTGYDMKHLFIAGEGTLGIVTAAVLKLFPKPKGTSMALAALDSPQQALGFFNNMQSACGPSLTAFELIERRPFDFLYKHFDQHRDPISNNHPWYVLVEISSQNSQDHAESLMQRALESGSEQGLVRDAAIASSLAQNKEFWLMRENISWAQKHEGISIKHDISVPIANIPIFLEKAEAAIFKVHPGIRVVCFGHMGDGNLHYNLTQPEGWEPPRFRALEQQFNEAVYDVLARLGGSISAEHGIGRMKMAKLASLKMGAEMDMMVAIKQALDPNGIMNPGKLIDPDLLDRS